MNRRSSVLCSLLLPALLAQEGLRTRRSREAIVKTNASKEIAEGIGHRVDEYCDVLGSFYDELSLEPRSSNKIVVRLFDTFEEYEQHYRRAHAGADPPFAYYSSSLNAVVLYNDEADLALRETLVHEVAHQFMNRYLLWSPRWLGEGMSEYLETWRIHEEPSSAEKKVNLYDLVVVQSAIRNGQALALRELVEMDPETFLAFADEYPGRNRYLHYATAWGLIWFSFEMGSVNDAARLRRFLRDLRSDGQRARFDVDDWNDLEDRWRTAMLSLAATPVDGRDYFSLAAGYRSNEEFEEALVNYEEAISFDPTNASAHHGLAHCLAKLERPDEALFSYSRARELNPTSPSHPYMMSALLLHPTRADAPTDPARALELAEEASRLAGGESPRHLELVARCHFALGETRKARQLVRGILRLVKKDDEDVAYYKALEAEFKRAN